MNASGADRMRLAVMGAGQTGYGSGPQGAMPGFTPLAPAGQRGDPARPGVRGAIARAAQATGVDFTYLLAQARLESAMNPQAQSPNSSASGLFQFTNATWATSLRRHGAQAGLGDDMAARMADPAGRSYLMSLRHDPQVSAMLAAHLAADNATMLTARLGHAPDPAEMYLAHFLGGDGAVKFLNALSADPNQSAAAIMPKAAAANRTIFFDNAGNARSLGEVMGRLRTRLAGAMQAESRYAQEVTPGDMLPAAPVPGPWDQTVLAAMQAAVPGTTPAPTITPEPVASEPFDASSGPLARQFAAMAGQDLAGQHLAVAATGGGDTLAAGTSMAEALRNAVEATSGAASAPDYVRAAYGRLRAMGL